MWKKFWAKQNLLRFWWHFFVAYISDDYYIGLFFFSQKSFKFQKLKMKILFNEKKKIWKLFLNSSRTLRIFWDRKKNWPILEERGKGGGLVCNLHVTLYDRAQLRSYNTILLLGDDFKYLDLNIKYLQI